MATTASSKSRKDKRLAGGFNHDLSIPRIPGGARMNEDDIKRHGGDPSKIINYYRRKMIKNQGGQDLPGFLKKA